MKTLHKNFQEFKEDTKKRLSGIKEKGLGENKHMSDVEENTHKAAKGIVEIRHLVRR